ncbi:MAG TPA: TIGR03915 family putative DNA repair protein [Flavobacterium sp.]|uniref:TIGR03915 family putative DNA repair protein n=1 Tax=Flavobacterium sp. TaxID=239 RepID=UPI002C171621|nr:TIGR03915 family putative DNA repair protein [Flavobacterium sp.]HSD13163.1 TIGR03915 family putative DNA repair protein [Flavobacterium sp.]
MTLLVYDGSMEGFLSAVFHVYEYKISDAQIRPALSSQDNLFGKTIMIEPDTLKAERVWKGLTTRLSGNGLQQFYRSFLSEVPSVEDHLLQYCRYVFSSKKQVESDFTNHSVLLINQLAKQVYREKHRMEAFVRFQLTADNIYYAVIEPDFNVLPLLTKHFRDRYADQQWIIYDSQRKYALYYDLNIVSTVEIDFNEQVSDANIKTVSHKDEALYQRLWQQYFQSVNIEARKNLKLHIRHMPKRYWRKLIEKQLK